ncbi:hypothetical protein SAMN05518672_11346 [Chitinophaga sp. CF118]|nr:hypothetical protein SAMN05518672_11346 [Chitinophaga sp. CF118]
MQTKTVAEYSMLAYSLLIRIKFHFTHTIQLDVPYLFLLTAPDSLRVWPSQL